MDGGFSEAQKEFKPQNGPQDFVDYLLYRSTKLRAVPWKTSKTIERTPSWASLLLKYAMVPFASALPINVFVLSVLGIKTSCSSLAGWPFGVLSLYTLLSLPTFQLGCQRSSIVRSSDSHFSKSHALEELHAPLHHIFATQRIGLKIFDHHKQPPTICQRVVRSHFSAFVFL